MRPEHWLFTIPLRLRLLFRWSQADQELDDELRDHLDRKTEEYVAEGMTQEEAQRRARLDLGGVEQTKEKCRDARRVNWIQDFVQDLRYGLRVLRKSPGFTTVAVLTLALGIGANTAIFSMINGILLASIPYQKPDDLYVVREDMQLGAQLYPGSVDNGGNFEMWRRQCGSFAGIAALEPVNDDLDLGDSAVQVHGTRASANLFSVLGVHPQLGRPFLPEEDQPGRNREVILTHTFWSGWLHSNPGIIGKTIRLNGYDYTVVGVLPSDFYFPKFDQLDGEPIAGWTSTIQYFVPLALEPWEAKPAVGNNMNFTVIARLKPGVTRQQALADLDSVEADISRHDAHAFGAILRGNIVPFKTAVVGGTKKMLWMLIAGAGIVLVIVCVNLASLQLSRSVNRTREMAVRAALGATRWSLLRQCLAEGVLLVGVGGALGLMLAIEVLRALIHSAPVSIPRLESIHVDFTVLTFTIVVSLAAGLMFSFLPALRLSHAEPLDALKSAAATTSGAQSASRLRNALTGAEVALCTVVLISTLLLTESLIRVIQQNRWLDVQHVVAVDLIAPTNEYRTQAKRQQLYDTLLAKVGALPGAAVAGFSNALPLRGGMWGESFDFLEAPQPEDKQVNTNVRFVSPNYFRAIGIPLLEGRFFAQSDEGQHEVILSEAFARDAVPRRDPIGTHLRCGALPGAQKDQLCTVTGVVADTRTEADQVPQPIVYFPYWVWSPNDISLVVRAEANPESTMIAVRGVLRSMDPQIAIPHEQTMRDIVSEAVAPRRFVVNLGILFAGFATFLAALGLYGVISFSVAQRTHEIGIRMALGADRFEVVRMVIARGLKLSLRGLSVGLVCAFAVTRLIGSLLYGVKPTDTLTFAVVSVLLIIVALLASYIPARRATHVDPMVALRYE